jgi:hypothetical protein
MPALEDPARLETMADERGWPRFIDRSSPQPNFMTVIGTWRADRDGQSLLVSVATSKKHGRSQTICSVVFEEAKPIRSGFIAAMSAGWELDTTVDYSSEYRHEMYAVRKAGPKDLVLEMTSTLEGQVLSMTLLGAM